MPGEIVIANNTTGIQYPEATFLHNADKPFEVHRMIARITPFDNQTPPVVLSPVVIGAVPGFMNILEKFVRLRVRDTSKNENMTKNAQLIGVWTPENRRTWEWEEPYTMVRSEGFEVSVDNVLAPNPTITVGNTTTTIANLRVECTFEGYLVVIAPASETR